MIEAAVGRLPDVDFAQVHKLADAVGARGAGDAFDGLMNAVYDWLAARARRGGGRESCVDCRVMGQDSRRNA